MPDVQQTAQMMLARHAYRVAEEIAFRHALQHKVGSDFRIFWKKVADFIAETARTSALTKR